MKEKLRSTIFQTKNLFIDLSQQDIQLILLAKPSLQNNIERCKSRIEDLNKLLRRNRYEIGVPSLIKKYQLEINTYSLFIQKISSYEDTKE